MLVCCVSVNIKSLEVDILRWCRVNIFFVWVNWVFKCVNIELCICILGIERNLVGLLIIMMVLFWYIMVMFWFCVGLLSSGLFFSGIFFNMCVKIGWYLFWYVG